MDPLSDLSVIVITRNEERDIAACLESVRAIASEIIVVDSGSTDRTLDIVRGFTDRVFHHEFSGFSAQKQFALEQAGKAWVLNIDADERVSPTLAHEIKNRLGSAAASFGGFHVPYHHYFRGRRLRFGGVGGETHIRLFRRTSARYGATKVHEGIHVDGRVGQMQGAIEHYSYHDLSEYLRKCNRYTSLIAEKKAAAGKRFRPWHHLRLPWEFTMRYVVKGGFFDGEAGLTYAVLSSFYVWLKYAKLKDLRP